MQETADSMNADILGGDVVRRYAERLARHEILAGLVGQDHPVLASEAGLVRESEEDVARILSENPDKNFADRLTTSVLSRAAGYLRAYGCSRADLGRRVGRMRPVLERAVGSSPFSAPSAA